MGTQNLHEDTIRRIKRGLSGYISYLAACEMNSSFSEYMLYEPMLRILTARGYTVTCEYPIPNNNQGDHPRIDFVGDHDANGSIAIEVKWKKENPIQITSDINKLNIYKNNNDNSSCFFLLFGRRSHIENWDPPGDQLLQFGDDVYAEFSQTRYGCRVYILSPHI